MKSNPILGVVVFLLAVLTLGLALANFGLPVASAQAPSHSLQIIASQGDSEVGSTDGILVMGIVITLIIVLPLLFRKK